MRIETERLMITEFTRDMAQAVRDNSLDEDNRRFVPDEVFESVEEAAETVEFLMRRYGGTEGPLAYPVILKNSGEIGYHIAKKHTGRGYAAEAVKAFLPVIADTVGADEVWGICLSENPASKRVLQKCGFKPVFEGIGDYQGEKCSVFKALWKKSPA